MNYQKLKEVKRVLGIQENKIIMEKFKEYTREKWEELGLLEQLPEDRKEMTVFCYNIVIKWITDDNITSNHKIGEIEPLILPIFYRIAKIVDLTEEQVLKTCKEFRQAWLDFDPSQLINVNNVTDPELHFVKSFAEEKINQYKK